MDVTKIVKLKKGYYLERLDGEITVYHPTLTTAVYLNETGALIWELCDGGRSPSSLPDRLSHFSTTPEMHNNFYLCCSWMLLNTPALKIIGFSFLCISKNHRTNTTCMRARQLFIGAVWESKWPPISMTKRFSISWIGPVQASLCMLAGLSATTKLSSFPDRAVQVNPPWLSGLLHKTAHI